MLIDFDQPDYALLRPLRLVRADLMAGFLGALEYVLEEGPRYDWLTTTRSVALRHLSARLGGRFLLPAC